VTRPHEAVAVRADVTTAAAVIRITFEVDTGGAAERLLTWAAARAELARAALTGDVTAATIAGIALDVDATAMAAALTGGTRLATGSAVLLRTKITVTMGQVALGGVPIDAN
jgi:hypothetical protein